jgi:peptidoglycan/xylan/chitin deacetylase (PgdA/CDA1 family)
MYHYVRPIAAGAYPKLKGLEIEQFEGQLDYLERHYIPVAIEHVIDAMQGGSPLPERAVLLTFDDGYRDHADYVFPALERRGIKGAYYPVVDATLQRRMLSVNLVHFVLAAAPDIYGLVREVEAAIGAYEGLPTIDHYREKYLASTRLDVAEVIYLKRLFQVALPQKPRREIVEQLFRRHVSADPSGFAEDLYMGAEDLIRLADAGHHIGGHTASHPWLGTLSADEQESEVDAGLAMMKQLGLNDLPFTFCYPYGSFSHETLRILERRRCQLAFTADVSLVDVAAVQRLEVPRLDTIDLPMQEFGPMNKWTHTVRGDV